MVTWNLEMLQERVQNGMTAALQSSEVNFPFLPWLGPHCSNVFFFTIDFKKILFGFAYSYREKHKELTFWSRRHIWLYWGEINTCFTDIDLSVGIKLSTKAVFGASRSNIVFLGFWERMGTGKVKAWILTYSKWISAKLLILRSCKVREKGELECMLIGFNSPKERHWGRGRRRRRSLWWKLNIIHI